MRHSDGLAHVIQAATGTSIVLSDAEYRAVRQLLESEQAWVDLAQGTIEQLTAVVGARLTDRNGADNVSAARSIVRGLLEAPGKPQILMAGHLHDLRRDRPGRHPSHRERGDQPGSQLRRQGRGAPR